MTAAAAAARMMHQTKLVILLSLNAVAILIVGLMIFSAINLNGGIEFRVVSERSDVISASLDEMTLLDPVSDSLVAQVGGNQVVLPAARPNNSHRPSSASGGGSASSGGVSANPVPRGELWSEDSIVIYQTADFDICVGGGMTNLGDMYWQSSNQSVIAGFYNSARTWLGYDSKACRYPAMAGPGTTTITAGTYDGERYDKLTVTVIAPPVEQWKRDVLDLVNHERANAGLGALGWGTTCEGAAMTRARELIQLYSHTRPDDSSWQTACPIPASGGKSGENLNAGNAAVSPETVVRSWMNSPEHRKNILDPDFRYLSVGFVFEPGTQHKTYWSQYFTTY